jgi:hypothetical protein
LVPPDSVWQDEINDTAALVPVKLIVSALLAALLFTVSVAVSFAPPAWLGVNRKIMVQLDPLATSAPLEHVPVPVFAKSPAFPPLIVK